MPLRVEVDSKPMIVFMDFLNKKGYSIDGSEIECASLFADFSKTYEAPAPESLRTGSLDAQSVELMQDIFSKQEKISKKAQQRTSQMEKEMENNNVGS